MTPRSIQHADSEGALLGERRSLRPAASEGALARDLAEPRADTRPSLKELIPRSDSLECGRGSGVVEQEGEEQQEEEDEEESYKEDILMGDDQVADFASSVLAAISCWHYKAKALLSTHFTTVRVSATHGLFFFSLFFPITHFLLYSALSEHTLLSSPLPRWI